MDPEINPTAPITVAGTYWFPQRTYGEGAFVEFAGTFGTGTVQIVYKDLAGATTPFKDLDGAVKTFTAANFVGVDVPKSGLIGLTVTVAGGTSLKAALHSAKDL